MYRKLVSGITASSVAATMDARECCPSMLLLVGSLYLNSLLYTVVWAHVIALSTK